MDLLNDIDPKKRAEGQDEILRKEYGEQACRLHGELSE
jgi:hypothetical protein